jgi:hypothetical protein
VDTPAFAISVMPSAASVAEYCVSRPATIAACRSAVSSAPVACVAAFALDMALSNWAADTIATPANAVSPADLEEGRAEIT